MHICQGIFVTMMLYLIEKCECRPAKHHGNPVNIRRARIDAIKEEILIKMGMNSVPDVSRVNTTHTEMRKMIQMYKRSLVQSRGQIHELFQEEEFFAKTFHSFTDTGPPGRWRTNMPSSWIRANPSFHFKINLPQPKHIDRELHLHSAKLRLYKYRTFPNRLDLSNEDTSVVVTVYMVLHSRHKQTRRKVITTKVVSLMNLGWEEFDVQTAVGHWMKHPSKTLSLEIVCESRYILHLMDFVTRYNRKSSYTYLPSLDVYIQEKEIIGRARRSPEVYDCVRGDGEKKCCRFPLWVSFRDIGWDSWILEPEGYQAYYCDGSCPHQYKPAHTFAGIKSAIHLMNPAAAPEPCCTNTKLSPLTLLHYDDLGMLKVSEYSDMIVQECKCA